MITLDYYHEKFPVVRDMIHTLYKYCGAGGCCHIVTDDDNIYDEDLDFVIEYAQREENKDKIDAELSIAICKAMKQMTFLQRAVLFDSILREIDYDDEASFKEFYCNIYKDDEELLEIKEDYDWDNRL